ncbi:MAG TPA: DinB family protein [Thermoanaerobaculia bacterium]
MTNSDFFVERWESEQAAFRKVLAALPADKLEYCPHERSSKAGNLAWQLVTEQEGVADILKSNRTVYEVTACPDHEGILAAWDKATAAVREAIKTKDEAKWEEEAEFIYGGVPAWKDKQKNMLWGFLFDMVHHRGQLSTYIRPMGGKVPSIYGPSGDSEQHDAPSA